MEGKPIGSGWPSDTEIIDFSAIQVPPTSTLMSITQRVEDDQEMCLTNFALMQKNNPMLANALLAGTDTFESVLQEQVSERFFRQQQRSKMVKADIFDTEAQQLIADEIKQKNIDANMRAAMEYSPETFGTVVMLFINCFVNGYPVKAFVDSGAQTTIISTDCAKRCNIMRLVDTKWSGIAKGVGGVQKIIGRIHMVQLRIEQDFFTTSFCVLEDKPSDVILGLDILRRYQCSIDLTKNVLLIGTTGTETKFLPESDLPEFARLSQKSPEPKRMKRSNDQ